MSQEMIQGYGLSPQQRRLWGLGLADRCAVCAVQVEGELDVEGLQHAIRHVVSQHEALRTTFKLLPAMTIPVQVISEAPEFTFVQHDQDADITKLLNEARERKIDYERLPVLRVDLIERSSHQHALIISLPVLCADVQSLECLVSQIAASSQIEVLQYADFAEWKNELLVSEEGALGRQFWRQQDLSDVHSQRFSFEKRTSAGKTFQLRTQTVEISEETSARIRMLASRCQAPLSSFALACWQVLISRLSENSNVTVGVAFEGRKFAELEQSIGLFSTFVPVRNELPENLSFEEFLKQTTQYELEAQKYQEYFAWENVVSFFPFCFEFRKSPALYKSGDLEFSIYERDACTDRFTIKFTFHDDENQFSAALQYDENWFSTEDVRRVAGQLSTLIADASDRANATLDELELLGAAERQL